MTAWNESLVSHCKRVILNQHQACFIASMRVFPQALTHTVHTGGWGGKLRFWLAGIHLADMTHPTGPLCHSALWVTNCKAD